MEEAFVELCSALNLKVATDHSYKPTASIAM
jgi:hypothetical protein